MRLESSGRTRPASLNAVVAEVAATVLVHGSFWMMVLSMFSVKLGLIPLVVLLLLPIPLYFLSKLRGIGTLTPVYAIFLPVLTGLIGAKFFGTGFLELFNYLAKAVNEVHELALFPTASGYPTSEVLSMAGQASILLIAFLMAGLFAYAICRKVKALAISSVFLPALIAILIGLKPSMASFIFYAVSATFYLILLQTRSKGTARRLTWLNGELSVALLVFLCLLAGMLSGFERSERVEELRTQIAAHITAFRYAPEESVDGMPDGDLNQAGPLTYDESTVLTVEGSNLSAMYLRGYSGDVLNDGKWEALGSDAYFHDYSLTSPWVRSNAFSPATSFGQLLDLKWQVQTTQYENGERDTITLPRYTITIQNERAYSDRMFVPYEISSDSKGLRHADLSQEGILAEGLRGKRSYELIVYHPLAKDYGNVSAEALIGEDAAYNSQYGENFVPAEQAYSAFVQENELAIPEEYAKVIRQIGSEVVGTAEKQSDAVFRIRSYFAQNFEYSLDIEAPSAGEDPILTFLTETKTGYCAHFASVAVLLLRDAGFPARYAEGYYVSSELASTVEGEEEASLEVPDSAAHAWVELYKEGVGWVPVEFTPGYFETQSSAPSGGTSPNEEVTESEESSASEEQEEETTEEEEEQEQEEDLELEETDESESEQGFNWILVLLPVVLLILLLPLLYNRRLRGRIAEADSAETTALAYRYLMRVLRLFGLKPDEAKPRAIAHYLSEEQEAYLSAIDLFAKETFSEKGLSSKERAFVCDTVLRLTSNLKLLRAAKKEMRAEIKHKTEAPHGK